jgi:CRP/FNR family cyclic AMP-dependent transcriptional regulator
MIAVFPETPVSKIVKQRVAVDALEYLPCSALQQFARGQVIYDQNQTSDAFYLIMDGKVKVTRSAESRTVLVDIYQQDEFFGESTFIGSRHIERATALEPVRAMVWPVDQINLLCMDRPKLGIALLQFLVKRMKDIEGRIESLALDGIQRRLGRTLLRFSERFGEATSDGKVSMDSLTHQLLAEYVGTSREIVSHFMNEFRNTGHVEYSRRTTVVNTAGLTEWLGNKGTVAVSPRQPIPVKVDAVHHLSACNLALSA